MIDLDVAIGRTAGEHRRGLDWFRRHAGTSQTWSAIQAHAVTGVRLVTQAKGIYKPSHAGYALSVRQTLASPYANLEVEHRADGTWTYPYFQEDPRPANRDKHATNRGLMKCMADGVPVGVLIQTKAKPGVVYEVLGLAMVTEWKDGYFILEGFSAQGQAHTDADVRDASYARAAAKVQTRPSDDFDAGTTEDRRERTIAEVVRRRGQQGFRTALLAAYSGRCAITGCDAAPALEAAHIVPYGGEGSQHPQNGLLLRADLHSLFDLGLLAVDSATMMVRLAPQLQDTVYGELNDQPIRLPDDPGMHPSRDALEQHRQWAGI